MKTTVSLLKSQDPAEFLFRGNAMAAGGFLTSLRGEPVVPDPQLVTVNGESHLPMIGGISHAVVEDPPHRFPQFINYGRCETHVEGSRVSEDTTVTSLRASVDKVHLTTSPSPEDEVPDVQSISFRADRLSIALRSTHPLKGQASFEFIGEPEILGAALVVTRPGGDATTYPIRLEFDQRLLSLRTLRELDNEFLGNRDFFDQHSPRFPTRGRLSFGTSRIPRTRQGYVFGSIVKQIALGDEVISGGTLVRKGFGTIRFGVFLADPFSRRIAIADVSMGSDPRGRADFCCVETNGIWK